jgi:hypothetical protein
MVGHRYLLIAVISISAFVNARHDTPRGQPDALTVIVIDSLSRMPLPNADIAELNGGQHRITDEGGRAYLSWPSNGKVRLRVREVGYQPRNETLEKSASAEAITFAMNKVAYVLSDVRATGRCSTQLDTTLLDVSVVALDQLKQSAEKFDEFRRSYPFEATVERRTAAVPEHGDIKRIYVASEKFRSDDWQTAYRPGDVIQRRLSGFSVPILQISTLADSVFWEHHCFVARGFGWYQGDRVVRLEFSPTRDVTGPDYKGSAVLDSATSMLLRIDFELTNSRSGTKPTRLEGYTTFMSPSPFVVLPDSTVAVWWLRNPATGDPSRSDYIQSLHVESMKYRKQTPPAYGAGKQ